MRITRPGTILLMLAVAAAAGAAWFYTRGYGDDRGGAAAIEAARDVWTCPMHPEIREHGPGTCPKCGMDLVRESSLKPDAEDDHRGHAAGAEADDTPRGPVQLDTRRRQLLGVRTVRADRRVLERRFRAVGLVRYDETRLSDVNLKLDGYVRSLHVDSTGQAIRRGQPLLDLYSPDLLASANEYILALATRDAMKESQVPDARAQADRLVDAARQRLALWDLPEAEIAKIERTRKAEATMTFRSPVSGVVIDKPVVQGMRVMPGQTLYRVADLSTVWVEADIFESDAPFVKVGAPAVVTLDAWPGEEIRGRAVHVYPFVDEQTRTLRVRFALANPRLRLKPGMYANVEMVSSLGNGITVPADAVLEAGREQFVFLAEGDGYYLPRKVQLGQRLGDRVQIREGLAEGEAVAAGAAFFLDSESQLRAATGGWEPLTGGEPAGDPSALGVAFATEPDPPRSGENTFEVRVTDTGGAPVTDAEVNLVLHMPAMPSMNMPAMTSEAKLAHQGGGIYRGDGLVTMAGRWDVTIAILRDGRRIGGRQTTLVAR